MTQPVDAAEPTVRVGYGELVGFVAAALSDRGVPAGRAHTAATALCYSDLVGQGTHGVANLVGLYLSLLDEERAAPGAELETIADRGASLLIDAGRALGLWAASEAMDSATQRARTYGIGLVSVRSATHFGAAGYHARRAVEHGMVGLVASNCGRQRIARPPHGRLTMLGTNPLSVAAPAGAHPPFVLDMSTTAAPTSRVRHAARTETPVPTGWLADDEGTAVTDPAAFDRGDAHLLWLGGDPQAGGYKGFGLAVMVEVLAGLVPGAGLGPAPEALEGDGRPSGRDDDIGFLVAAIAPATLRPEAEVARDAHTLFDTLLACPPDQEEQPVRYAGWHEAWQAEHNRRHGVPVAEAVYDELSAEARRRGLALPAPLGTNP